MTTFTTVDEGFMVSIYPSFEKMWLWVNEDDVYLEADNQTPLTKRSLKAELKEFGTARIFKEDCTDWTLKIQKH
jgi:hypothetical protein